jgi:hypothetical protein
VDVVTTAEMRDLIHDLVTATPYAKPNAWGGLDVESSAGFVRLTAEHAQLDVYGFTQHGVLLWSVKVDAGAPAELAAAVVLAALREAGVR